MPEKATAVINRQIKLTIVFIISIVRKVEIYISPERAIARLFRRGRREHVLYLHIPHAVISIPQACRFAMQTDNFNQRAKHISVASYLRIPSFLNIRSTNPISFPSKKSGALYHIPPINTRGFVHFTLPLNRKKDRPLITPKTQSAPEIHLESYGERFSPFPDRTLHVFRGHVRKTPRGDHACVNRHR